jgi:hypothetical protein
MQDKTETEAKKIEGFYFSSPTKNMQIGRFKFDHRGLLVVDSAEDAAEFKGLLESFGRGIVGAVSDLGNYNPYEKVVDESATGATGATRGPTQTSQSLINDTVSTPVIAIVTTAEVKEVVVGEIKPAPSPVTQAGQKQAFSLPKAPAVTDSDSCE